MKSLSVAQQQRHEELTTALNEAIEKIHEVADKIDLMINSDLNTAIAEYNTVMNAVADFRDHVVDDMESYMNAQDEEWVKSAAGSQFEDWKSDWEAIDIDKMDPVDELDINDNDTPEYFGKLKNQPDA